MGSIDAGTTTVVDHAHMNYSVEHTNLAVSALVTSGIRSIFCYCANPRVKSWNPEFTMEPDFIPDWFFKQLHKLATEQPFGDGRVHIGLTWDTWSLPKEVISKFFEARMWGIKLITCYHTRGLTLSKSLMNSQPVFLIYRKPYFLGSFGTRYPNFTLLRHVRRGSTTPRHRRCTCRFNTIERITNGSRRSGMFPFRFIRNILPRD